MKTVFKIWWSIDSPDLLIPLFGLPSSVKLEEGVSIKCRFPEHAVIGIVRRNKRFLITPKYKSFALLETKIVNNKGDFRGNRQEIEIEAQDPDVSEAIIYYQETKESKAQMINLVRGIVGFNQIVIGENGIAEASPDLSGLTIKARLPIIYKDALEETNEFFTTASSHLVGLWEDNTIRYLGLYRGQLKSNNTRSLEIEGWKDKREEILFKI